jgi:hypothetical protein
VGDEGDFWRDVKAAKKRAKQAVADWNAAHAVGIEVIVTKDRGEQVQTRTTSAAQMLSGHSAVIWLEGLSGCYALERVRPAPGTDDPK